MNNRDETESADGNGPQDDGGEDDRNLFADLLERVEEQRNRSPWTSSERGSESQDSSGETGPWQESNPITGVRERIPDEFSPLPSDRNFPVRPAAPSGNRKLYIGMAIGVVLALVLPGVVAVTVGHVEDTVFAPAPGEYVTANDTVYLETSDARYLSRIFRESTHEVAYCGLITDDRKRPTLQVWMANTVNAGPDQIQFITDNCPDEVHEVLLHTHPNGVLSPSEQDVQTLLDRPEHFLCIQGGPLQADPGDEVEHLACYRELDSPTNGSKLARLQVVMATESSIFDDS